MLEARTFRSIISAACVGGLLLLDAIRRSGRSACTSLCAPSTAAISQMIIGPKQAILDRLGIESPVLFRMRKSSFSDARRSV